MPADKSSTSFWPNAEEREVLRRWQGTVVEPARMFSRLLDVLEEVEAERAALLDVAEAAQALLADWDTDGHENCDEYGAWCVECWVEWPCPTAKWRLALANLNPQREPE